MQTQSKYRLLVVRLGAMGDILHALPAITALRQAHPSWIIDWVVEPRWRALLASDASTGRDTRSARALQPLVDTLHMAPAKEWGRRPISLRTRAEVKGLRRTLREARYDAVLDLQGAVRSAWFGRAAHSRRLIGEAHPREWLARFLFTERVRTSGLHVIEQDLELASAVAGDALSHLHPRLPFDPAAEAEADRLLPPGAPTRAVVINPGAGWGAKRWPIENYAQVAVELLAQGFEVLVNAGPGEEPLAQGILDATQHRAQILCCSLEWLIAVLRRVQLVIAGDTGPLHLACALGKPVVGIYGPTDPSRNGPFATRFRVLRSPLSRRDHTRYQAPEAGLLTIAPEQVLAAVHELLAEEGHTSV